jgi:hypothetical protein
MEEPISSSRGDSTPDDIATTVHSAKNGSQAAIPISNRRRETARTVAPRLLLMAHGVRAFTDDSGPLTEMASTSWRRHP